jgi:hypothetical protein
MINFFKKLNPNKKIRVKPEKPEPKPSQTEKIELNRFEPVLSKKNRTEPNRNRSLNRFQFFLKLV